MNGRVIAFLSRFVGRQAEPSTGGRSTIPSFPSLITEGEPSSSLERDHLKTLLSKRLVCGTEPIPWFACPQEVLQPAKTSPHGMQPS